MIDEYDVPLENAWSRGFYDRLIDFIRALFESGLKDNTSLEFAAITGCLRVSKESIFTGLNNLNAVSKLKGRDMTPLYTAFVIVFKVAGDIDDMDAKADEALRQIAEKRYDAELRNDGYKYVSCYGIAFCGKECAVHCSEAQ